MTEGGKFISLADESFSVALRVRFQTGTSIVNSFGLDFVGAGRDLTRTAEARKTLATWTRLNRILKK